MSQPPIRSETTERTALQRERDRLSDQQRWLVLEHQRLFAANNLEGLQIHAELLKTHTIELSMFQEALHRFHERYHRPLR